MSALKVSLSFLDGPVPKIISKGTHIAKSMNGNEHFPIPPVSPEGLQSSVNELKLLETKAKGNQRQVANRDIALSDVNDFIQQNAAYVEHACKNNLDILLTSGFDPK